MASLEELLEQNYKKLKDTACVDAFLRFLRVTPSAQGLHPVFIKQFTKVGLHILREQPEQLDGLLQRLYDMTVEGIQLLRSQQADNPVKRDALMHAHLYGYLADFALGLYQKTRAVSHIEACYRARVQAILLESTYEPAHVAHLHTFAADAAHLLFSATMNLTWAEKAHSHLSIAYPRYLSRGDHTRARSCLFGHMVISEDVFAFTREQRDAERLHDDALNTAMAYDSAEYQQRTCKTLYRAIYAARKMSEFLTPQGSVAEQAEWLERQYDYRCRCAALNRDTPARSVEDYVQARRAARKLYHLTGHVVWFELAFDAQASAALAAETAGKRNAAHMWQAAAKDARKWYSHIRCRKDDGTLEKDGHIAECAYECQRKAAVLYAQEGAFTEERRSYADAARFAQQIHHETGHVRWKERLDAAMQEITKTRPSLIGSPDPRPEGRGFTGSH